VIVAIKALAHKLARACYHMLREQKPFDVARCSLKVGAKGEPVLHGESHGSEWTFFAPPTVCDDWVAQAMSHN